MSISTFHVCQNFISPYFTSLGLLLFFHLHVYFFSLPISACLTRDINSLLIFLWCKCLLSPLSLYSVLLLFFFFFFPLQSLLLLSCLKNSSSQILEMFLHSPLPNYPDWATTGDHCLGYCLPQHTTEEWFICRCSHVPLSLILPS